jgi:hypothetical protein
MRFIPTKVHGAIDYAVGSLMTSSPLLGVKGSVENAIPVTMGIGATAYSLFTDYELGVVRALPMKTHLTLDMMSGAFLVASPFIFKSMNKKAKISFIALGLFEIAAGLFTKLTPKAVEA